MKTITKVIIAILVGLIGCLLLINGLVNEDKKDMQKYEEYLRTEEVSNTTTNTITIKKVKATKKTTKKTKKKVVKKVATSNVSAYHEYAKSYGNYDDTQMSCLINLWNRESGWNPNSYNKSSGACGIPQALPCSKISKSEGSNDWKAQIRWGIKYISARYKTPCGAWKHFQKKHWY